MSLGADPFQVFNFEVTFKEYPLSTSTEGAKERALCSAAFSEITGLEATMEPKVIKEGGRNFGPLQRVGPVSFSTVILKRGITSETDLWSWFNLVAGGNYSKRMNAYIRMRDLGGSQVVRTWKLHRALPVKFKTPDLNATGTAIGIEELHLAHEGLELLAGAPPAGDLQAGGPEPGAGRGVA
jgi:phage tail-like protein